MRKLPERKDTVAICLIGSARHFELTSVSLKKNLLHAYENSDVFVIASLDHTAWKLHALLGENIVYFSVAQQQPIDESQYPVHILSVPSVQGQLQQFLKIESCIAPIAAHERALSFSYSWLLWSRLDGYWAQPPPPLSQLDPLSYSLPSGQGWGGVNDRGGVGRRSVVLPALKRLSSLPALAAANLSGLNGEKALQQQLQLQGIPVALLPLPFCIFSFRRKKFRGYQFARLWSPQAVGGVSCKVCPLRSRNFAHSPLCSPFSGAEAGWQQEFLRGASAEEAEALRAAQNMTRRECCERWKAFEKRSTDRKGMWECPPPKTLCRHLRK